MRLPAAISTTSWVCSLVFLARAQGSPEIVYVSPTGSGPQCTEAYPCSLIGARDRVRTMNRRMSHDILVRLADGTYQLSEPLELVEQGDIHDSGSNGHIIRYEAAPSAHPILSGGTRIRGWTLFDPARSIYRAVVPKTLKTRQLYVRGMRAIRARGRVNPPDYRKSPDPMGLPGFFNEDDAADVPTTTWKNQSHLEIVNRHEWVHLRCPIESTQRSTQYWMAASNGFSFQTAAHWPLPFTEGAQCHVGDFNGDGRADLYLTWPNTTNPRRDAVALSVGTGFAPPTRVQLPRRADPGTYQIGDFDGNGTSDLLVAYADDRGAFHNEVFLTSDSGFEKQPQGRDWLPGEGQGCSYRVGDFNGDGRSDLLLASRPDASGKWRFDVALSDGAAFRFLPTRTWLSSVDPETLWDVGNFDGDPGGKTDLLLAYETPGANKSGTNASVPGVWHNDVVLSNGSRFDEATRADWLPKAGRKAQYRVGNFDGDDQGKSDLLLSFRDATGLEHHRVALSSGHGFVLGEKFEGLFPEAGTLGKYVGNFDGDAPRHDDILAVGPQTFLRVRPACWQLTAVGTPELPRKMQDVAWIENALELLDAPREWYLDEETPCPDEGSRCIYYMPERGEDLTSTPVVAATLETLVRGRGDPVNDRWLHDVQFRGLTFAFATWLEPSSPSGYPEIQAGWHGASQQDWMRTPGAVTFSRAKSLVFRDNVFAHLGAVGLNIDTASQDVLIEGNLFTDLSSTAIQIGDMDDYANPLPRANSGILIANNYISKAATEYESAVGIWAGYVRNTVIRNNEIGYLPYTGISLGWGWGVVSYAASNEIRANFIHDTMMVLHDGGAIYTQSPQPWSTVSRNFILNSGHLGIYHDDGSRYFKDTENVIAKARVWLQLSESVYNCHPAGNWIDYDNYFCRGFSSHFGSAEQCNFHGNRTENNHFVHSGPWPPAAQAVVDAAGLEPKYRALRYGFCGDATCAAEESAGSCPRDCQ